MRSVHAMKMFRIVFQLPLLLLWNLSALWTIVDCSMSPLMDGYTKELERRQYDKFQRPDEGRPTVVKIRIYINSISSINERSMDLDIDYFLERQWTDPRLRDMSHDQITAETPLVSRLWLPHVYFINTKTSRFHNVVTANRDIQIYPDGFVEASYRVTAKLSCPMDLKKFPMDQQTCNLEMEAGYASDTLQFKWVDDVTNRIEVNQRINTSLPKFYLLSTGALECQEHFRRANHSCLRMSIHLQRQFGFYLIQVYIPSIFIVVVSWLSFALNIDAAPARTSIGFLTLLNITSLHGTVDSSIPKVSYLKAIDIWYSACVLFVFAALFEFAIANSVFRYYRHKKHKEIMMKKKCEVGKITVMNLASYSLIKNKNGTDKNNRKTDTDNGDGIAGESVALTGKRKLRLRKQALPPQEHNTTGSEEDCITCKETASRIDLASIFTFPFLFLVFNVVYWIMYGEHISL
ncbi:glycine receptor subunit alpha-4-like [Tubulanus polymorphus]|uniref:glycine receptor subunit alpha-4-like n=1 Tax=Tubulanus polymorphus TaxID=672921 RepID=UPI003DA3FD9D